MVPLRPQLLLAASARAMAHGTPSPRSDLLPHHSAQMCMVAQARPRQALTCRTPVDGGRVEASIGEYEWGCHRCDGVREEEEEEEGALVGGVRVWWGVEP